MTENAATEADTETRDFIRDQIRSDLSSGATEQLVTRFPTGTKRLPSHRSCEIDLLKFWCR